jgi:hypothetical protein
VTEKDFDHRNVVVTVSDLVRVDWMGRDEEEVPSLVSLSRLDARAMTEVRREVRRLDSNAYEVTGATRPPRRWRARCRPGSDVLTRLSSSSHRHPTQ